MEIVYRFLTIVCLVGTYFYWIINAKRADKRKPKRKIPHTFLFFIEMHITKVTTGILLLQLLGLPLFSSPSPFSLQTFGCMLVLVGTYCLISARKELADNWTHAAEYQVKKNHSLITSGIYRYVRHPIYFGANLTLIGGELVAHSYIAILFMGLFFYDYLVAKREEEKLISYFGKKYKNYQQTTKMLIPFIF